MARALLLTKSDLEAALSDYCTAFKINPNNLNALQGQASVLSKLNRTEEAIEKLNLILKVEPENLMALAGRGVLYSRLQKRTEALADAEAALKLSSTPPVRYQVAGIYARTSRQEPADLKTALELLENALRQGFGFDKLKDDKELATISSLPEFAAVVQRARQYRETLKKSK
jgi:tetratricopeptide (TPR) repeat protein